MRAVTGLNGRVPDALLSPIGAGFRLRTDAAASYARMLAAGMPAEVTTAYRTLAEQTALYDRYGYPRAQPPGSSQHGEGLALDVKPTQEAWLRAHGAGHGWRFTVAAERWHAEYFPDEDPHPTPPAPQEDDDMTPDQDRILREVHAALGAGGALGLPAADTVLAHTRNTDAATHGLPDALTSVRADVAGVPVKVWDAPVTADDGTGPQTWPAARWLTILAFRVRDLWGRP